MPLPTRRTFLRAGGASVASLVGLDRLAAAADPLGAAAARPRAAAVLQIHLAGGLSHLDTFDPKPEAPADVRGPFGTVPTALDGLRLTELLRRTARVADRLTLVRSMTHSEADHDRGTHSVLTGFQPSPAVVYPSLGSVVAHELGMQNDLPPYVCVPNAGNPFLGSGYLGAAHGAFAVGDNPASARFRVRDLEPAAPRDDERRRRRDELRRALDAGFRDAHGAAPVLEATEQFYEQARALVESPEAKAAFDLRREPDATKDAYGRHTAGMSCLLARRLVQAGVRYAVVELGGFDHHQNLGRDLAARMNDVDQAFAALIGDLEAQGLFDRTLVLLTTEFGRTPRFNGDAGRDHWPRVFSTVLAGAGIKRGHVHGASSANGAEVEADGVSPGDLAATVFTLLGIDPGKTLIAPGDRPLEIVRGGRVLREVLA